MKVKCKRAGVIGLGILSIISLLTGCVNHNSDNDGDNGKPVELSEGATLTGLFMTHQGMAVGPYYILRIDGDNRYMKITGEAPDGYRMTEDMDTIPSDEEFHYFGFVDEIKGCERASLVQADETIVKQLTDVIIQSGALNWNGYSKHRSMEYVDDAGDSFGLFLTFSDGSTVKVDSYNSAPDGWTDFYNKVSDIFEANADYSRYAITELSEENCDRLIVEFYDGFNQRNDFKADIYSDEDKGVWVCNVRIKDTDGLYFDKGTDLSLFREKDIDTLSYGRLVEVLRKNNVESWNGMHGTAAQGSKYMNLLILDKDGKKIEVNGNIIPDNYDEVRDAFVEALMEFYKEQE